jgi:hypothetical protein
MLHTTGAMTHDIMMVFSRRHGDGVVWHLYQVHFDVTNLTWATSGINVVCRTKKKSFNTGTARFDGKILMVVICVFIFQTICKRLDFRWKAYKEQERNAELWFILARNLSVTVTSIKLGSLHWTKKQFSKLVRNLQFHKGDDQSG